MPKYSSASRIRLGHVYLEAVKQGLDAEIERHGHRNGQCEASIALRKASAGAAKQGALQNVVGRLQFNNSAKASTHHSTTGLSAPERAGDEASSHLSGKRLITTNRAVCMRPHSSIYSKRRLVYKVSSL